MTTGKADEQSAIEDVFSNGSDMGADSAAPVSSTPAPEAPAAPPPAEQTQPVTAEPPEAGDDDGETLQGRDPKTGRFVPVTELIETRKKLKGELTTERDLRLQAEANAKAYKEQMDALQRQFLAAQQQPAQPQEPIQPPDPFAEPEAYAQYQQQIVQRQLINQHCNTSEMLARAKHGDEIVNEALNAARQAGIAAKFIDTSHPYEAMIAWYRRAKFLAEVGDNPDAYREKIAKEAVEKALAGLKSGGSTTPQNPPARFPTTLADQTATGEQGAALTQATAIQDVFAPERRRA